MRPAIALLFLAACTAASGCAGEGRSPDLPAGMAQPKTDAKAPPPALGSNTLPAGDSRPGQRASARAPAPLMSAPAGASRPASAPGESLGRSVLPVGPTTITVAELLRAARPALLSAAKAPTDEMFLSQTAKALGDSLYSLVGEVMVEPEADKRLSDEQKSQITKEVDQTERELIAEAGGSRAAADAKLRAEGTSLEQALRDYRRQVIVTAYLRGKFNPVISVTRRQLWDYYRANQAQFATPTKVQMQIVAAMFRAYVPDGAQATHAELDAAKTRARESIQAAAAALKDGQDFAQVARQYSRDPKAASGGLWPLMEAGSFREEKVEQAAFALQEGQVSDIIEAPSGFYIVKAAKVVPGSVVSFEQAQPQIEDTLHRQQYRRLADEYYQKLLKDAAIGDASDFLNAAIKQAAAQYRPSLKRPPSTEP